MEPQPDKHGVSGPSEDFVTVVNVESMPPAERSAERSASRTSEAFVMVLSIGDKQTAGSSNGIVDPAHPEEEVEVYRLPGERLGFGLKFEGGNKTSEKVRRLFIQSCAEQSPASRAKCSWGNLGEGDEVLSIDQLPVTQMTRLDCVRRLKESQLVLKLMVRHRGALRPEVVSAERKLSGQQEPQEKKVPPELPAAPPPVPPRKLRHLTQAQSAANRGLADGEASPGTKRPWDSPKSGGSSQNGSPQSQASYRSAASSVRSSNYESCASSPAKSGPGSKNDSPKDSPKAHVSPVLNKAKQEPPAEAQSYLDARSQDGSSTHGSTSDDTSSSLSTVVDRFSSSDRFSTTSTASTTSEQLFHQDSRVTPPEIDIGSSHDALLDLKNPADFLLTRLANSEARTHVESRGDVERVTAVVAPNTVLIEETPALQPPLSFQDAPLSYGHEPRPGIFYTADLAADSRTHFRPIKDDADVVEKVFNGDAKDEDIRSPPVLPVRNHINRIPVNQQKQQEKEAEEASKMPMLPPKPMPRKDVKAKRKRPPPPPPPPPRREPPPPVPEARNILERKEDEKKDEDCREANTNDVQEENKDVKFDDEKDHEAEVPPAETKQNDENANEKSDDLELEHKTNKVLEIVEMKKAKALSPQKPTSRASDECEVPERGSENSANDGRAYQNSVELKNSLNREMLADTKGSTSTISFELENDSEDEMTELVSKEIETNVKLAIIENEANFTNDKLTSYEREEIVNQIVEQIVQIDENNEESRLIAVIRDEMRDMDVDEDDLTDESDGDDYYWQSNLATIGEEEENNSLEYENANEVLPLPVSMSVEKPQIIESVIENSKEATEENARDEPDCVRRIARDSGTEDKKQDKNALNGRMDNCGGGGQRLPPDGDEFPAAYQEFTSPSQQYQYVTTRETMATNGDVDRGESVVDGFLPPERTIKTLNVAETRGSVLDKKDSALLDLDCERRTSVSNYVLYSTQKNVVAPTNLLTEKKIEIAGYYPKDAKASDADLEYDGSPPPLPLTGPPSKMENGQRPPVPERKFTANGDLWRQDNKSEKSVKDKIAMFSSQSTDEAPLFPSTIAVATTTSTATSRRLSKHKSSDDVFNDEKRSPTMVQRTQSSFDLVNVNGNGIHHHHQKTPSLPQSSPPSSPGSYNGYSNSTSPSFLKKNTETSNGSNKYSLINSPPKSTSPVNSYSTMYNGNALNSNKSFDGTLSSSSTSPTKPNGLMRATSFSGSSSPYGTERLQTSSELLGSSPTIARTNSLASTFKRPADEIRKSSLNQLIEQRRKGMSKLRGLVIPEKDAVPIDQPITDLPEIKSRDSILVNQVPKSNIHDKWGSQSSIASNASTVSSIRTNTSFKMPAPKMHSSYSPAFKRKSLAVYGSNNSQQQNNMSTINNNSKSNGNSQLTSPASEAPKSLESICSPTRSDYSFEFVSSSGSPDNQLPVTKPKLNCQRKIGRNEYDDSDNDSAVSSSQSSISRGFSPPMSPVPSDRSTISSERSYLSSETPPYQRPSLILENKSNGTTIVPDKNVYNTRSNLMAERSFSVTEKSPRPKIQQQIVEPVRSSQIPQRQLKRSSSTETNSSISSSSTLTSGSQASAESLSRRVLKPQSVEAINRKNILASARCRSGRDLNGSPLIQRKFSDDEAAAADAADAPKENGFVNAYKLPNGNADSAKPQIKIAYIEITENVVVDADKFSGQKEEEIQQPQPRLPPKRSIIPQAKTVPIPTSRPPKPEPVEASNDMKSWVRAEMRSLSNADRTNSYETRRKQSLCDVAESTPNRSFNRSKSTLGLNESSSPSNNLTGSRSQLINETENKSRSSLSLKKAADDQNDLLTVLTTKSRSRSAIHVEDTSYGKLKSQMSLEDILASKSSDCSKLPRSQSVISDKNGLGPFSSRTMATALSSNGAEPAKAGSSPVRRSSSTDSWCEDKLFPTKIPSLSSRAAKPEELGEQDKSTASKIPTARNLGRRSASVTDMKKVFEKPEIGSSSGTSSPAGQLGNGASHNRFPSLDSSVEDNIRPEVDQERFSGEQFGSISSLASSTSLISQQELAQLVEEANLEEPRGGHDVVVVLLHKENPSGSVGITLAGGVDCETKEITIHRVLAHSIADRDGSVQRGDRILSINGRSMRGLSHRESMAVLKQPRSEVVLVVSRAKLDDANAPQAASKLRSRTESVETIVEGYETNGVAENTAWGPPVMVPIYKDGSGLGFSLEGGRDSPLGDRPLLIKKIFSGGAADKTGALQAGDQLLEVNNRDVSRISRIEAWSLMKKLPDGEVNLLVRHPAAKSS